MKLTHAILCFLFFSINTYCQNNANTMLWRISGKGLTKPSYLFGTIHLNDKRVFQLGDSVYYALENTEGFAGELDMNRVGNEIFSYFMDKQDFENESPRVNEVVDQEVWDKYKKKLEKQIGKSAEDITIQDLDHNDNRFETELLKKGDMP